MSQSLIQAFSGKWNVKKENKIMCYQESFHPNFQGHLKHLKKQKKKIVGKVGPKKSSVLFLSPELSVETPGVLLIRSVCTGAKDGCFSPVDSPAVKRASRFVSKKKKKQFSWKAKLNNLGKKWNFFCKYLTMSQTSQYALRI